MAKVTKEGFVYLEGPMLNSTILAKAPEYYSYAGPLAIPAKLYIFSLYKIQLNKEKMIYAWTLGKKL